jgi:uncharacterized protein with GYD domain
MAHYVLLMKRTEDGMCRLPDEPRAVEKLILEWEALGGVLSGFYATMGDYDYVLTGAMSRAEDVAVFSLRLEARGELKVSTLRAFGEHEIVGLWTAAFPDPDPPYTYMHKPLSGDRE